LPPASESGTPPVRDAATVVLLRRHAAGPQVLMGQRGLGAVFMPNLFVFPGGAVDPDDTALDLPVALEPETARRLAIDSDPALGPVLARAAVRELWEETGLLLGRPDPAAARIDAPPGWRGFLALGLLPETAALRLIFRAITPPGRPRRFDARFFLVDAAAAAGSIDAPTGDELRHLQWLDLAAARDLPLPFITEIVLSEVAARAAAPDDPRPVPFFHQRAGTMRYGLL
jgi:8-oxo-dGTP pyrophosphatase MutT (NUDIX family)